MAYHPIMFVLLGLVAAAETGLTAYLVSQFQDQGYPGGRDASPNKMQSLLLLILVTAAWTTFFALAFGCFVFSGTLGFIAGMAASLVWLVITIVLWAVSATLFHRVREGGQCIGEPTVSLCRQFLAVEAIAWTALALSILCIFAGCFAYRSHRAGTYRRGAYRV